MVVLGGELSLQAGVDGGGAMGRAHHRHKSRPGGRGRQGGRIATGRGMQGEGREVEASKEGEPGRRWRWRPGRVGKPGGREGEEVETRREGMGAYLKAKLAAESFQPRRDLKRSRI